MKAKEYPLAWFFKDHPEAGRSDEEWNPAGILSKVASDGAMTPAFWAFDRFGRIDERGREFSQFALAYGAERGCTGVRVEDRRGS